LYLSDEPPSSGLPGLELRCWLGTGEALIESIEHAGVQGQLQSAHRAAELAPSLPAYSSSGGEHGKTVGAKSESLRIRTFAAWGISPRNPARPLALWRHSQALGASPDQGRLLALLPSSEATSTSLVHNVVLTYLILHIRVESIDRSRPVEAASHSVASCRRLLRPRSGCADG